MLKNKLIKPYLCHPDGDSYYDRLNQNDLEILERIVFIEEIPNIISKSVNILIATLDDNSKIKISLYNQDREGGLTTNFKIIFID